MRCEDVPVLDGIDPGTPREEGGDQPSSTISESREIDCIFGLFGPLDLTQDIRIYFTVEGFGREFIRA